MLQVCLARLKQKHRTIPFPAQGPTLPDRFRGLPLIEAARCRQGCQACADACPTSAIEVVPERLQFDLGRCLFCNDCVQVCSEKAIRLTQNYRLATRTVKTWSW